MDFDKLTADEVDALDGYDREAWYAYRAGDTAKVKAIRAAQAASAGAVVADDAPEAAVGAGDDVETATPAKPRAARKPSRP